MQRAEQPQRLADPDPLGKCGVLQLGADPPAQAVPVAVRVETEDAD